MGAPRWHQGLAVSLGTVATVLIPLSADSQATGRGGAVTHDHRQVNLPAEALVIDAAPLLQVDSRPPNPSLVGATTARRLRDGRIVVAIAVTSRPVRIVRDTLDSAQSRRIDVTSTTPATRISELLFFDEHGAFLGTSDRQLPQPASHIDELSDGSIAVIGRWPGWFIFDANGRFLRSFMPTGLGNSALIAGVLDDGSVVSHSLIPHAPPPNPNTRDGFRVDIDTMTFTRFTLEGESRTRLPFTMAVPRNHRVGSPVSTADTSPVTAPTPWPVMMIPSAWAARDVIWAFDVMRWEIRLHDRNGRLHTTIRLPLPEANRGATIDTRGSRDSAAVVSHLLDDTGRLWIESPNRTIAGFDSNSPRVWWLLAHDGRLLGSVRTPIGFRPMQAGADFVLGMQGTRTLAVHRLIDARRTR